MPHIWVKNPTAHKVRIIVYAPSETTYKMESGVFELKIPLKVCSRPSRVPREDHPSTMVVLDLPFFTAPSLTARDWRLPLQARGTRAGRAQGQR